MEIAAGTALHTELKKYNLSNNLDGREEQKL